MLIQALEDLFLLRLGKHLDEKHLGSDLMENVNSAWRMGFGR